MTPNIREIIHLEIPNNTLNFQHLAEYFPSFQLKEKVIQVIEGSNYVLEEEINTSTGKYFILAVSPFNLDIVP